VWVYDPHSVCRVPKDGVGGAARKEPVGVYKVIDEQRSYTTAGVFSGRRQI